MAIPEKKKHLKIGHFPSSTSPFVSFKRKNLFENSQVKIFLSCLVHFISRFTILSPCTLKKKIIPVTEVD